MAKDFTLTAEEAQFLLERSAGTSLPCELGEQKFDVASQSISNYEMAQLYDGLRAYSPHAQSWGEERLNLFGDLKDWLIVKEEGKIVNVKHLTPSKPYHVRLNNNAINGAMWILFLSLYPSIAINTKEGKQYTKTMGNAIATGICWPIAAKFGKTKALQSQLKINPAKSHVWEDDADVTEEKKADVTDFPKL